MLHSLIFLTFSHNPQKWMVKYISCAHEDFLLVIDASCHCPSLFIICKLFFVKYLGHVKNVCSWTVTKGDEGKDEESGVKEHYHCYSSSAFKTNKKEV